MNTSRNIKRITKLYKVLVSLLIFDVLHSFVQCQWIDPENASEGIVRMQNSMNCFAYLYLATWVFEHCQAEIQDRKRGEMLL